jgi:hypothetical protein
MRAEHVVERADAVREHDASLAQLRSTVLNR